MDVLTVVLVVVGLLLALLLVIVVYTIRKYLLNKNQYLVHEDKSPIVDFSSESSGFEVPITTRALHSQFHGHEFSAGSRKEICRTGAIKERRRSEISRRSPRTSLSSIGEKEERLVGSVLPVNIQKGDTDIAIHFDRTQRRISHSMLNVLAIQGKQGSNAKSPLLTEEMFKRDLENNMQYLQAENSFDENSSVHSLPEVVPSSALGVKRKVIERRPRKGMENILLKRTYKKSGKIKFTTSFFAEERMLELHVHKVFGLTHKKDVTNLNIFVRVYLIPGKRQRKETQPVKGKEPFFNEKVQFVDLEKSSMDKYRMKIKVYNKVRVKKNELLGEVDIALSSIDTNAKETFTPDLFLQRSESSLATVSIIICHQATYNKLEVTIQKATNLSRTGVSGQPNTYASVQLFKEHSIDKKDTAVKKTSREPVFNEVLEFDVETDLVRPLSRYSLVVTMNHKSSGVVGKDEVIGHVVFSMTSPQRSAADHWKYVCETPHKHVNRTHSLVDPDELMCFSLDRLSNN